MEVKKMKCRKVLAGVLAAVSVVSMSVGVMASGSVSSAVDTNKVTAETTTQTEEQNKVVGGLNADIKVENVENVAVTLTKEVENIYEEVIQKAVKILNEAKADTTVADAFKEIFADKTEEEMPKIQLHKLDGTVEEEEVDLSEYKFISPVMELKVELEEGQEISEENPVEVTFTANNMTDEIQVDVLHYCEEHEWEVLEGEKVSENQIKASFHSASPIALIYKELPEEETEVDTEVVAP
jgi:hypothetical protein